MKIRSEYEFNEALDQASSWRKKEISAIRLAIQSQRSEYNKGVLRRASVPLLYAHWEGFTKEAATCYLYFVAAQRQSFMDLRKSFMALAARGRIRQAVETRKIEPYLLLVDFVLDQQSACAHFPVKDAIDTMSNLSSIVFHDILLSLGLSYDAYWEGKKLLIDGSLLKSRNEIAHGDKLEIDEPTYEELHTLVIELLSSFKTLLENAATNQHYLRTGRANNRLFSNTSSRGGPSDREP